MSYARFGPDSDVYVFLSVSGNLECCACLLEPSRYGGYFDTTDGMLAHLAEHERAGHRIPGRCVSRLREDAAENDAWIAAGGDVDAHA